MSTDRGHPSPFFAQQQSDAMRKYDVALGRMENRLRVGRSSVTIEVEKETVVMMIYMRRVKIEGGRDQAICSGGLFDYTKGRYPVSGIWRCGQEMRTREAMARYEESMQQGIAIRPLASRT